MVLATYLGEKAVTLFRESSRFRQVGNVSHVGGKAHDGGDGVDVPITIPSFVPVKALLRELTRPRVLAGFPLRDRQVPDRSHCDRVVITEKGPLTEKRTLLRLGSLHIAATFSLIHCQRIEREKRQWMILTKNESRTTEGVLVEITGREEISGQSEATSQTACILKSFRFVFGKDVLSTFVYFSLHSQLISELPLRTKIRSDGVAHAQ
jgi:hypothetical protein